MILTRRLYVLRSVKLNGNGRERGALGAFLYVFPRLQNPDRTNTSYIDCSKIMWKGSGNLVFLGLLPPVEFNSVEFFQIGLFIEDCPNLHIALSLAFNL